MKYLSLRLDRRLNFSDHVTDVLVKARDIRAKLYPIPLLTVPKSPCICSSYKPSSRNRFTFCQYPNIYKQENSNIYNYYIPKKSDVPAVTCLEKTHALLPFISSLTLPPSLSLSHYLLFSLYIRARTFPCMKLITNYKL